MYMFFLLFFLATSFALPQVGDDWEKFKVDFNRAFDDPAEEQTRKDIFLRNKQMVEEHNKKYEQGLVTYSLGINRFSDRTEEEMNAMRGIIPERSARPVVYNVQNNNEKDSTMN